MMDRYAVLDGPTMPIIGEGDTEPNDTYVEQLTASARAAVEEVVRRGVADPKRVAVGGHSYGAPKSIIPLVSGCRFTHDAPVDSLVDATTVELSSAALADPLNTFIAAAPSRLGRCFRSWGNLNSRAERRTMRRASGAVQARS
jgi:hypothetical protein